MCGTGWSRIHQQRKWRRDECETEYRANGRAELNRGLPHGENHLTSLIASLVRSGATVASYLGCCTVRKIATRGLCAQPEIQTDLAFPPVLLPRVSDVRVTIV